VPNVLTATALVDGNWRRADFDVYRIDTHDCQNDLVDYYYEKNYYAVLVQTLSWEL